MIPIRPRLGTGVCKTWVQMGFFLSLKKGRKDVRKGEVGEDEECDGDRH